MPLLGGCPALSQIVRATRRREKRSSVRLTLIVFTLVWSCAGFGAESTCREGMFPAIEHDAASVVVATLNIAHGRGRALNQMLIGKQQIRRNLDAVGRLLARQGADVVALQELDVDSLWAGSFDHAARLMESTGLNCAVLGMHAETWLYRFGTALLSEVQLTDPRVSSFQPTPPTTTKGFVSATLQWRQGAAIRPVRVVSVHLDFSRKGARRRQLADIIEAINRSPIPIILMGDFNEQWRPDDSVVRRLTEEAGMIAYQPQSDDLASYKTSRLDWILISKELEFVTYRTLQDQVSDHRLVVAELRWSRGL